LVQWTAWSLRHDPGFVPGDRLTLAILGVGAATLGALLALGWLTARLATLLPPPPKAAGVLRWWPIAVLLALMLLAAPVAAVLAERLPGSGVLWAAQACALLLATALLAGLTGWGMRHVGTAREEAPIPCPLGRGVLVGVLVGI